MCMARMFHSVIVAKSTAFLYRQILSILCQYDMGSISWRKAKMQIAEICNRKEIGRADCQSLPNLVDWEYVHRKVDIAYTLRERRCSEKRKDMRKKCTGTRQ